MNTPTQGQTVIYHPRPSDRVMKMIGTEAAAAQDTVLHTAVVAHVLSKQLVNLACFDSYGNHYASQGVVVKHDITDELPEYGGWCEALPAPAEDLVVKPLIKGIPPVTVRATLATQQLPKEETT